MLFLRSSRFLFIVGLALYGFVFLKNAWVSDDAYIVFRSLDQLLSGHGPRWNPFERAQVFTCPLWYWLLAGMGWLHRNHYLNSIILSATCNILLLLHLRKILADIRLWLLAVVMLVWSQAYFDFTTSGLENPLVYCLLTFIVRFYLDETLTQEKRALYIGIAIGLLLITRHDALLFVLPLLAHCIWQHRTGSKSLLLAALLPLTAWTLFALIYYGFPFPNTAYAKLGDIMPRGLLLQRGITYFSTSILRDFISIAVLLTGIVGGIFNRDTRLRLITTGVLLHLTYVVWIGGDFMRGRFFGWDYLLCTITLLCTLQNILQKNPSNKVGLRIFTVAFFAITGISFFLQTPPIATPFYWGAEPFRMGDSADGITQERYFFFWFTRFTRYWQHRVIHNMEDPILDFGWCQDGIAQRQQNIPVAATHTVGMHGYCLGTDKTIIDLLGITDPLLARMPRNPSQKNWRAGHFLRLMPDGYCDSVLHHDNRITDPVIAHYYDTIRLITQSEPLFSAARLLAIWRINTGGFDKELTDVRQRLLDHTAQASSNQSSCPLIVLPESVIKRLRNPQP